MGNCQCTQVWMPRLDKPYVVRLERHISCCNPNEFRELFINDVKMENFAMNQARNTCAPLCGRDVSFAWQDQGHQFLLQFNSLTMCSDRYYRLFLDGVDVDTGLGFSAYFKRQGNIRLIAALIFFILCGGGIALVALLKPNGLGQLWLPINTGVWALIFFITGILLVRKFTKKHELESVTATPVWPEAYRSTNFGALA